MTDNDKFFERQRQPAAVFKHALLSTYVTVFGAMTSSTSAGNRVWYIDGYAGPGIYDPQPGEARGQAGSPMLALGTARKLAGFKKAPRDLRCAFIEADKRHAEKLASVMAEGAFTGFHYKVLHGQVEQHIGAVVSEVGSDPLLTFLDPFGTSLPWALMKSTLFGRTKGVANEVLLNMSVDSMRRIGGLLGKQDTSSVGDQKTLARLDNFLGDTGWRELFLKHYRTEAPGSATVAALEVAKQFRARVYDETGYRSFTVPIRKLVDHEPIFLMALFYTFPGAAYKFANAASSANERWRKSLHEQMKRLDAEKHPNTLFGDDFNEKTFEEEWKRAEVTRRLSWETMIAENLVQLLDQYSHFKIVDHLDEVYGRALGLARETHLRTSWNSLASRGQACPAPSGRLDAAVIRRPTP